MQAVHVLGGRILWKTASSFMCLGSGDWTRIPSTAGSALSLATRASSSA